MVGLEFYGKIENQHPEVLDWIRDAGFDVNDASKVPWCGIFVGMVVQKSLSEMYHTNSLYEIWDKIPVEYALARSWQHFGDEVKLEDARQGDLVVFWRESIDSYKGHVAFYVGEGRPGYIFVLGGNQDDQVNIKQYAISRILTIRRWL